MSPARMARRLGVTAATFSTWIADGLPVAADGRVDPFPVCAWLCWHRPTASPVLARRWAMFARYVGRHVAGTVRPRRLSVERRHTLHLPRPMAARWWLPRLTTAPGQPAIAETPPADAAVLPSHLHWELPATEAPGRSWSATVALAPVRAAPDATLVALVEELVADFRYAYRRHQPWCETHAATGGSCLDASLELGVRLSARGRPWRLCAGVWARTGLATPHLWLEVAAVGGGWTPVDPSLPAIARMLGAGLPGTGWRAWARAWTGSHDGLRVTLGRGDASFGRIPGGATLGALVGEATAADDDGAWHNAWPCLDWAQGSCPWTFGPA